MPRDWLRHQPSLLQVQIPHRREPRCQCAGRAGNSMNLPECNHESMINYLDRACSRSGGWIIVPAPSLQIFSPVANLFSLPTEAQGAARGGTRPSYGPSRSVSTASSLQEGGAGMGIGIRGFGGCRHWSRRAGEA